MPFVSGTTFVPIGVDRRGYLRFFPNYDERTQNNLFMAYAVGMTNREAKKFFGYGLNGPKPPRVKADAEQKAFYAEYHRLSDLSREAFQERFEARRAGDVVAVREADAKYREVLDRRTTFSDAHTRDGHVRLRESGAAFPARPVAKVGA